MESARSVYIGAMGVLGLLAATMPQLIQSSLGNVMVVAALVFGLMGTVEYMRSGDDAATAVGKIVAFGGGVLLVIFIFMRTAVGQ